MARIRLSDVVTGHRFRLDGLLFEASYETRTQSRQLHRRVSYCEAAGQGAFQPGDKTWLPVGALVEPAPFSNGVI